ncbi:protein translocase SEC61 complex subunit gamma [Candidatus Woesearchaeota archaeon]|nr:protein translocase SEC61 complex subunit gamma [Candidatus Woesearchaeota archaeon]
MGMRSFLTQCVRVFTVTKKPSTAEFKMTLKVTGIAILIIGAIGFIISVLYQIIV